MEDSVFAVSDTPTQIQEILLAASTHNVSELERLIKDYEESFETVGLDGPNVQDPDTGFTPLHSAIVACGGAVSEKSDTEAGGKSDAEQTKDIVDIEDRNEAIVSAEKMVIWLLANGAQWNVLDNEGKTPGCRAWDLGDDGSRIYERIVHKAIIRELIVGKLERMQELGVAQGEEGYIELASEDEEESISIEEAATQRLDLGSPEDLPFNESGTGDASLVEKSDGSINGHDLLDDNIFTNTKYLSTPLTSTESALIDAHHNGVMMSWERAIMYRSASNLLQTSQSRLLNIGFGMGIFDSFAQQHENRPLDHHIVEAHPDVLERLRVEGWYERPGVTVHEGTWQNVCSTLIANGNVFDVIFYDTFAESYSAFRDFFTNVVPNLLVNKSSSRWSFFNGMGADRQICYDVWQGVVDCELDEAGWTAEFEEIEVPKEVIEGEEEWKGTKRKYWTVKTYRVPIVRFKKPSSAG